VLHRAGFVVAPLGRHATHAMRAVEVADGDGNALRLYERVGAPRV
jgi:hypothetical protein